jgi:hypothetical protein
LQVTQTRRVWTVILALGLAAFALESPRAQSYPNLGARGSHPRRQGAAAGRHRCGAHSAASGSADHDRKRLAGFTSYSWSGILAPAGTSPEIVDRLNAAINRGLKSPAMNSNLGRLGAEANAGSPQDFAAFIADETTNGERS